MGFCVLHYDKQTGSSPGLAMHIERGVLRDGEWVEWHPTNADSSRRHLNRELIDMPGSRNQRIDNRIKECGIKPRKNAVQALTLIMSASTEDMQRIASEGKLDDWCNASVKWAQETHGTENVVSAVLHMDEKTPHLHVTVVPIVQGESKDQVYRKAKEEKDIQEGKEPKKKRKYKKKDSDEFRLCAADVMARTKLKSYQTTYAQAVGEFGLTRGIDGSEAKHVDINDWYKTLVLEPLKENERLKKENDLLKAENADLRHSNAETKAKLEGLVKNTGKATGEAVVTLAKSVGKGIVEVGTYMWPSSARDREMKAKEEAKKQKERADKAVETAKQAIADRDKAIRDHNKMVDKVNDFIEANTHEINSAKQRIEQINQLKEENKLYKDLVQDCCDLGLYAEDVITLANSKNQVHNMEILNPATQENEHRDLKYNGSKLQIWANEKWEIARQWIESMLQIFRRNEREKNQSQQVKRSSGFKM